MATWCIVLLGRCKMAQTLHAMYGSGKFLFLLSSDYQHLLQKTWCGTPSADSKRINRGGSASLARPRGICMYGLQHKRLYRRNWTATNDYYWGHQSIETIQCLPQGQATIGYMVHPSLYKYKMWQVFQPSHNSIIMLKDKEPSRKISVQLIKQGFIKLAANYGVL